MRREGYIIVETDNPLFPSKVSEAIKNRSDDIVEQIEKQFGIALPPIRLVLRTQARGERSANAAAATIFSNGPYPLLRIVLTDQKMASNVVNNLFETEYYLIIIEQTKNVNQFTMINSQDNALCRIHVSKNMAIRAIEDAILDLRIGSFFRRTKVVSNIVKAEGLLGFFRRKANYCRLRQLTSSVCNISSNSDYGLISSLNEVSILDIAGRAKNSFEEWSSFVSSLSLRAIDTLPDKTPRKAEAISKLLTFSQISTKKMIKRFNYLPDDDYSIVILRKSFARKSPEIKNLIISLFGNKKRINSYRIIPKESTGSTVSVVSLLYERKFIEIINARKLAGDVVFF